MNKNIKEAYSHITLDDSHKKQVYEKIMHHPEKEKRYSKVVYSFLLTVCILIIAVFALYQKNDKNSPIEPLSPNLSSSSQDITLESLPNQLSVDDLKAKGFYIRFLYTIYNENKLTDFLKDVENNIPSLLFIAYFTDEGDPILIEINYNKQFLIKRDTTRDNFGPKSIETYIFDKIGYYEDDLYAYNDVLNKESIDKNQCFYINGKIGH